MAKRDKKKQGVTAKEVAGKIRTPEDYNNILPDFSKQMSRFELFNFLKGHSDGFKQSIAALCLRAGVGEVAKRSVEESEAKKLGLVQHRGVWIEPMRVVPERWPEVIDFYLDLEEARKKEKSDCADCKDLPEGKVAKGHKHISKT